MHTFTRTFAALALLGALSLGTPSHAEPIRTTGRFGLGLGSGTIANGLSAKYFMNQSNALQFNLGEFGGGGVDRRWKHFAGFGFGVDYLYEMPTLVRAGNAFELAWNIGAGVGVGIDDQDDGHGHGADHFALAAAFVLGLEFNFIPVPIDLVLEFRPGLLIVPRVDFDAVDFTAQLRFYF